MVAKTATRVPRTVLTNEEKETLICFDETSADATIFTYNAKWQRHLEGRFGLKPVQDNGYGGKEYHIPKSRIRMPQVPKKMSEEQRQKLAGRLREARQQKSPKKISEHIGTVV